MMDTDNEWSLSLEQVEFFKKEGYLGPFRAYSEKEVDVFWKSARLKTFDYSKSVFGKSDSAKDPISSYDRHLDIDELAEHVCHPAIVAKLQSLLGRDVSCWRTEFFPKYPGDKGTDWHQGDTFAGLNGGKDALRWPKGGTDGGTITVWTALTDVTLDMGPMGIIPGTQNTRYYDETKPATYGEDKQGFYGYDYSELQVDPNWRPDESKAIYFTMKKGEFIIFWSTLLHGSLPHTGQTSTPRLGYASRYVPTSVRVYPDADTLTEFGRTVSLDQYGTVIVGGEDRFFHNRVRTHTTRGTPLKRLP
ncbi:chlorinating enzyme [Pseudomonas graminis]|uniref:chlorinating enzyme n=1 Tax=Pseudomonas graminis TaxID=158627 RepID=UPI00234B963E|nr:chlorinating enzyme [Pseudomonas graminis]MDC6382020.1 chlorinating enzyme [Pseudomonas graminis]